MVVAKNKAERSYAC